MKRILAAALAVFLSTALAPAQQPNPSGNPNPAPSGAAAPGAPSPAQPGLSTPKQKASYGIGLSIGASMRSSQLTADDLDIQAIIRGITDSLSNAKPALSNEDLNKVMEEFHKSIENRQAEQAKTLGDKNKKEGEAFLAANKSKEGVKTTASGLQYKVLKSGAGATPGMRDTVTAHYKGTLLDGSVFDSSYDRGKPESFSVAGVIQGWTEALQLMKVGDKWQLFIPSGLAYKEQGAGQDIGPNATLVFEVELLDVKKPGEATAKGVPQ